MNQPTTLSAVARTLSRTLAADTDEGKILRRLLDDQLTLASLEIHYDEQENIQPSLKVRNDYRILSQLVEGIEAFDDK